ncbi:hypothetical protein [Streptodolium elevatio]|uniref:Uncharacterized protein n=1 Tax=Streptodolium elevatio TaxID=3157996 RepID=A0ABV3DN33_9ACTN
MSDAEIGERLASLRAEGYVPLGHTRPWDTAPVYLMMVRNQPKQA